MSAYTDATRDLARAAETSSKWTAKFTTVVALGFAAHSDAASAAYLLFSASFIEALREAAHGIAEDPSRSDFAVETRVARSPIRASALFADDPFDGWALRLAENADAAARRLNASRLAFERLQGARESGARAAEDQRRGEAIKYAKSAATPLYAAASAANYLFEREMRISDRASPAWEAFVIGRVGQRPGPRELPPVTLALLYVGGVRLGRLEGLLGAMRPTVEEAEAEMNVLRELPAALTELARHMEGWEPPPVSVVLRA